MLNIRFHPTARALALAALLGGNLAAFAATGSSTAPAARTWTRDTGAGDVTVSLYSAQPLAQAADILAAPGEKRLRVVLQQRLTSDQIGRLLLRDAEKHSPRGEFAAHVEDVLRIGQAFAARKELAAGHSFGFEFVPGEGTRLVIDDLPASGFVTDPAFFALMLRPWLQGVAADRLAQR